MKDFFRVRLGIGLASFLFLIFVAGLIIIAPAGRAHDDENNTQDPMLGKWARCSWDAPTYGTPVVTYVLEVEEWGNEDPATTIHDEITELYHDVWVEFGISYKARVAGIDAEDRQGPWSEWTPLYGPENDR